MSEYWKSQPKKFCQYCKCWIADNKPSVEFHERGKNHKENVSLKIAEMQKKSIDKAKQEDRQSKEFAAMEKAALKAYEEDMKRLGIVPEPVSQPKTEAQPPAPTPAPPKPQTQVPPLSKRQEKKLKKSAGTMQREPRNEKESWAEGKTDDGHTYYYSTLTGGSQWVKPEGFRGDTSSSDKSESSAGSAWMEAVSPDGFTYYYNTETGESSWEKPADLADKGESETSGKTEGQVEPSPSPPQLEPPGEEDSSKVAEGEGEDPKQPKVPMFRVRKRKEGIQLSEKGDDEEVDDDEKGDEGDTETAALPEKEATPAKKPRKSNPYGEWEKIQEEEDPYENVDLQLPKVEGVNPAGPPGPTDLPPEPKPKFKERTITSLGVEGGSSTFRKRKTENGKSRSLRQRGNEDD